MQFLKNVTLLGAGQVNKDDIDLAMSIAPTLVAADGGAKIAVKMGQTPEFVVGDFDSISSSILKKIPKYAQLRIENQNSTDFEKCLDNVQAPLILGVGFLGRRLDHQLAALHALVKYRDTRCILLGKKDVCFHVPRQFSISLKSGSRFSLFPFAPTSGRSTGLQWPIDGLAFQPHQKIGTSNCVVSGKVKLTMEQPGMIAILPRNALKAAVQALGAQ